jgi:quercetin dioxygenase-like cupin family protein
MKLKLDNIGGNIIKDNETYTLTDNNFLSNLTLSQTYLKPGQATRGHSHDNQEEVYTFTRGYGTMVIGEVKHDAIPGDTFLIKAGNFHRVINKSNLQPCVFTCVFEKYDRNSDVAKY